MKSMIFGWVLVAALILGPVGAAFGEVVYNDRIPLDQTAFVPCAAGGSGEFVTILGTVHVQIHETFDRSGGYHFGFMINVVGAAGVGQDTGEMYRSTGGNKEVNNIGADDLPFVGTFVNVFNLIGTAGGEFLRVHNTLHVTVNSNGMVSAVIDNSSVTCE